MLTKAVLYDAGLPAGAVRLWAVLDDLARAAPSVTVTARSLGRVLGYSERHVRRLAGELVTAGALQVTGCSGKASTFTPLHRSRRLSTPVDNSCATPDIEVLGCAPDPGHLGPGSGSSYIPRAHKEEKSQPSSRLWISPGPATRSRRPTWCGACHEPTRIRDLDDGGCTRCPTCHPASVPAF